MGGALYAAENSKVFLIGTLWQNNSSQAGGGAIGVRSGATLFIHNTVFTQNRTNLNNHDPVASGGAINLANADMYVTDTVFSLNEAGAHGGALQIVGTWSEPILSPNANVVLSNVLFSANKNARHPSVNGDFPLQGGGVNVEDHASLSIYRANFDRNIAEIGGAINIYRADVQIHHSIFLGNQAIGTSSTASFGGAIALSSEDLVTDGFSNWPSGSIHIEDSYFQGRYGSVGTVAHTGGCFFASGDWRRLDGDPTIPDMGTIETNRAEVVLENLIFNECDVHATGGMPGIGGGVFTGWTDIMMHDVFVLNSDAYGSQGAGGGAAIIDASKLSMTHSVFGNNTSDLYGGGLYIIGSEISISDSQFIYNEVSPGINEDLHNSFGAAIFSSPDIAKNFNVSGILQGNLFTQNAGLSIFEHDANYGAVNDLRYGENGFYETSFGDEIFNNTLVSPVNVNLLHNLTIYRGSGIHTPKSFASNTHHYVAPSLVKYNILPEELLRRDQLDSPVPEMPSYMAIIWQGGAAELNHDPLVNRVSVLPITQPSNHYLNVDGNKYYLFLGQQQHPKAELTISLHIDTFYLNWDVESDQFIVGGVDNGLGLVTESPDGSAVLPLTGRNYHFHAVTSEGGVSATRDSRYADIVVPEQVFVFEEQNSPTLVDSFPVQNIGGGVISWTTWTEVNEILTILDPIDPVSGDGLIQYMIDFDGVTSGIHTDTIVIDAGEDGTIHVPVVIQIADTVKRNFFPVLGK
jgi:hypothetical protein